VGKLAAQIFDHRVALGNGQALALELSEVCRTVGCLARQQDVGVFKIGATESEGFLSSGCRQQSGNQVDLPVFDLLDHLGVTAAAAYVEAQSGAQAYEFEQVGADAAKVAIGIEECQGSEGLVDHHADHRVFFQPLLFAVGQLQFLIGQQGVAAGTPAFGDMLPFARRDGLEHVIDDA